MIKGKIVVVTGGAGLLGKEFIRAIIENNGKAIIADINKSLGKEVKKSLSKELSSKNVEFIKLDITSKKSIKKLIHKINLKYGKIDAVVNNAYPQNKNTGRHFFDVKYKDFCNNIEMNIGGYFLVSQQFAKYFKKQGYGNIINIGSIYGVVAPKFEIYNNTNMTMDIEYAAIKPAIIHMTKYMAKYFKGLNIRVNSLSPGGILNEQNPKFIKLYKEKCLNKGMLDKSDLKGTLLYLLSNMSEFVNGQNIIVDDGFVL